MTQPHALAVNVSRRSQRGNSLAAVALNDATATTPGRRSSRSADAAVISATIGPTRTRVRLPIGETETTAALTWFMRESSGVNEPSDTSHG